MSRLNNAARKVAISGGVSSGRLSIGCEELANKYPTGVHVTAISRKNFEDGFRYHLTCIEEPGKYFSSGKVLKQKCDALLESYDGDFIELNKDLKEEYLELFLANKKGSKFPYVDAGFGDVVPSKNFNNSEEIETADDEIVDEETGEVIQPAETKDSAPF